VSHGVTKDGITWEKDGYRVCKVKLNKIFVCKGESMLKYIKKIVFMGLKTQICDK